MILKKYIPNYYHLSKSIVFLLNIFIILVYISNFGKDFWDTLYIDAAKMRRHPESLCEEWLYY